ncbi:BRCT domain-containing protein [Neocallimastix lanati (nom. inval.)]|nr:BRCT domain-containing protein [Neocallimastix sp. JGI-2020a]
MENKFKLPKIELFSNLNIFLDESNSPSINFVLKEKLIKRGANIIDTIDIHKNKILNYYITTDINQDIKSIKNFNLVTPLWVDISIKTNIVQNPLFFNPDLSLFFSGINAIVVGINERDCKELYSSIETFGGQWSPTYKKGVTHIITLFNSVKIKDIDEDVKIILPHWFEDCVKLKRRIPDKIYLHPNPSLLQFGTKYINQLYTKEQALEFIEPSYPYLKDKKFYIDPDIKKSNDYEKYGPLLQKSGVTILDNKNFDQADYIILKNKNNIYNIKQTQISNIPIVTEFWLYDVLRKKRIIRPYSKLCYSFLEYLDLPKMENNIITITNYHGQARKYIIQLIYALGAKFTSNMTTENTHIICGECCGKKYEKAIEWNIEIINHIWLEESYRNRCVQALTKPLYTYYPPQLNSIVGDIYVEWNNHQHIVSLFQQGVTTTTSSSKEVNENYHESEEMSNQLSNVNNSIKSFDTNANSNIYTNNTSTSSPQIIGTLRPVEDKNDLLKTPLSKNRKSKLNDIITISSDSSLKDNNKAILIQSDNQSASSKMRKIKSLGGNFVNNINQCTHLLTKKIAKTEKFIIGISICKYIINYQWLNSSYYAGRMLDESQFPLIDKLIEKEFSFSLKKTLNSSKHKKILENRGFIITPNVSPSREVLTRIIISAGGEVYPEGTLLNSLKVTDFIISSPQDKDLWSFYSSKGFKVYNADFVLFGILRQELPIKNKLLILA